MIELEYYYCYCYRLLCVGFINFNGFSWAFSMVFPCEMGGLELLPLVFRIRAHALRPLTVPEVGV